MVSAYHMLVDEEETEILVNKELASLLGMEVAAVMRAIGRNFDGGTFDDFWEDLIFLTKNRAMQHIDRLVKLRLVEKWVFASAAEPTNYHVVFENLRMLVTIWHNAHSPYLYDKEEEEKYKAVFIKWESMKPE